MEKLLSAGAIGQILEGQKPVNPVLQIIGYKPMTPDQQGFGGASNELRYRLMIGDGIRTHQYCVITNQDLVEDIRCSRLEKWSIIRATSYQTVDCAPEGAAPESKRRVIYILNLEVVVKGSEVGCKIVINQGQNQHAIPQPPQQQQYQQPQPPQRQQQPDLINQPYQNTQAQPYPGHGGGNIPMNYADKMRSPQNTKNYHTIGIGELTPYIGKWVIKGRALSKAPIREYNTAKGSGKVFSFTLVDKTGEIKVTAFNADLERVYGYVEPGKVYYLSNAQVKSADKRYSSADFEITLNSDSLLEEVVDSREINEMPLAKFNFVSIGQLKDTLPPQPVDLIGAIVNVSDVSTIVSKTKNKELKKRNVVIVDMSRTSIGVTIWGDQADSFTGIEGDIFVTKSARISSYDGKSASAGDFFQVNPEIPEARKIKNWFANLLERKFDCLTQDRSATGSDQWKCLEAMLNMETARMNQMSGPSAQYGKCKAVLMTVGKNPIYKCCPTQDCGKKLQDTQNGELKCDKCQQTYSDYKYRYKVDIEVADVSSSSWVTLWDEKAEAIFNMKPDELARLMKMDNKEQYERVITKPTFKEFIFTLRSRIDTYNNEERVKLQAVGMAPLDSVTYGKRLIEEIKLMAAS